MEVRPDLGGYPLVHIAFGKDSRGKWRVAKGVIAIGQFALGLITVAQFGVGLLFGFGQFLFGGVVLAQFAGGRCWGWARSPPVTWPSARWSWPTTAWANSAWRIPLDHFETGRRSRQLFLSWWSYLKQAVNY